jgi:adenine-specific DNA-methyltransferase
MAMTSKLLKENGQLIFITPRSYCSGLYFKAFRKWFFNIMKPVKIHIFESRKKAFNNEVLQETLILNAIKSTKRNIAVDISSSFDGDCKKDFQELKNVPYQVLLSDCDPEYFLKIPTSEDDLNLIEQMQKWSNTLLSLGFKISTGPVVDFRSKEFLISEKNYDGKETAPLFWMNNIKNFITKWPAPNGNKPASMKISLNSRSRLTENSNYVFVKRLTSKEQHRRIYAAVHHYSSFKTSYIGIENHLNYIWKTNKKRMSLSEAYGLMALFNSSIIDKYFRIVSGSTQVNVTEINNIPMPNLKTLNSIGKIVKNKPPKKFSEIDNIVNKMMEKSSFKFCNLI